MSAPLALAVGDPAGIGPEVARRALAARPDERFVVFGAPWASAGSNIEFDDLGAVAEVPVGQVSAASGRAQLAWLDGAIDAVRAGRCRGLVTRWQCRPRRRAG